MPADRSDANTENSDEGRIQDSTTHPPWDSHNHTPSVYTSPTLTEKERKKKVWVKKKSGFLWLQLPSAPSAHLTRADRAPVVIQHPNLPVVFHLPVMGAVARAVPTVRTAAVITSVHVKAHGVISTAVPPHLTFINVYQPETKKTPIKSLVKSKGSRLSWLAWSS